MGLPCMKSCRRRQEIAIVNGRRRGSCQEIAIVNGRYQEFAFMRENQRQSPVHDGVFLASAAVFRARERGPGSRKFTMAISRRWNPLFARCAPQEPPRIWRAGRRTRCGSGGMANGDYRARFVSRRDATDAPQPSSHPQYMYHFRANVCELQRIPRRSIPPPPYRQAHTS